MVVIVAAVLAFASEALKPYQKANLALEKQQSILKAVSLGLEAETAQNKKSYIENEYKKYIKDSTLQTSDGEGELFICTLDSGDKVYIFPVKGTGLWGPIWGYVALKSDMNTVYGTTFDHKSETPGLGAEINTKWFSDNFKGKQFFKEGEFVSIKVVKGGADKTSLQQVDAISGGTITSKALESMLYESIIKYENFLKSNLNKGAVADTTIKVIADTISIKN